MPLSPTVRGRYDSTVRHCSHYSRTVTTTTPFTILPLSPTLTPVGDPLPYKRRPVCNVEGVRSFGQSRPSSYARCSQLFKLPSSPKAIQTKAGVGFYAS